MKIKDYEEIKILINILEFPSEDVLATTYFAQPWIAQNEKNIFYKNNKYSYIQLIKQVRQQTGLGLKFAKDLVDSVNYENL